MHIDNLRDYLAEINKFPLLSKDEETALFEKLKSTKNSNGSSKEYQETREEIINRNLRLAYSIAKKEFAIYGGYYPLFDFEDFIQECNAALIKTVDYFDVDRGNKFSTYATTSMRRILKREVCQGGKIVRIPTNYPKAFVKLKKILGVYDALGIKPTYKQLSEEMGLGDGHMIEILMSSSKKPISIDSPLFIGNEDGIELKEVLESRKEEIIYKSDNTKRTKRINEVLDTITPKQREIIERRFGLNGDKETLRKIGESFGVTRKRIKRIETDSIEKLQHNSRRRKLECFVG